MKIKKGIAIALTSAIVMLAESLPVNAVQTGYVIDNDPIAAGFGMDEGHFVYMTASGCYNGDARRISSSNGNERYCWLHPVTQLQSPKTATIDLQVYLNHSTFTDPRAEYEVNIDGSCISFCFINQHTAPSTFGPVESELVPRVVKLSEVRVNPSGLSGYYTGADAISISYTY